MKKLKKEDVYINLQGKSEEELTYLYELVKDNLYKDFRINNDNTCLEFFDIYWIGSSNDENKQEVTIQQLKEILKPMETLKQQLEKAKAEVKRIEQEIEEQNKPKIGDWLISNDNTTICIVTQKGLDYITDWKTDFYKCTDQELINKLNDLINAR